MVDRELPSRTPRLGTIAAVLGVLSLMFFLSVFPLHNMVGLVLYFTSPALCALAFVLGIVELVRARRRRATSKEAFWAQLGVVSSLLTGVSWIAFYIWLSAFVYAMQHHR
jgi:peptidoglycan/LPS O-acetylase OafA/YrhL